MANEQRFTDRAGSYAKGRMGYAQGVVELILGEILRPGDKIADVGSGTGIFAREFMARGFDVYCVEPNGDMRARAEAQFTSDPHFISVAATAESTTLPDHSVALVTAASAFHWFDPDKFRAECLRILKPGGAVFTVINARGDGDPFSRAQHAICARLCPGFTSLHHGLDEAIPKFEGFFGENLRHAEFDFPLEYTKEKFIARCLSSSYAPKPGMDTYEEYVGALNALLEEYAPDADKLTVSNRSVAYWGRLA